MKKSFYIGNVPIGNGHISIQSMTNTLTTDVEGTIKKIQELNKAGAELVRVSVPDVESALCCKKIVDSVSVPVIADIHYSAKPALIAIENGVKKIRINPYNMSENDIRLVVNQCREYDVPIRIGVNKGSAGRSITPSELAQDAANCAKRIEDYGWDKLVIAVKSSDVRETVLAYRELYKITDYPLHVGLTESGTENSGMIKSAVAIGSLLLDGIGDTIRVSLATNPVKEVYAAKKILRSIGLDKNYVEVIACPTCARTCIEVEKIAAEIEDMTRDYAIPLKVAVMGCTVNGIGESKGADVGIAGGKHKSILFHNGEQETVSNDEIKTRLIGIIEEYINNDK